MHYKTKFVRFMLESGALAFGDFTLKNGRKTPYMLNTDMLGTGVSLSKIGSFYARCIYEKMELGIIPMETTTLFGLACKGVPLAAAASVAMAAAFDLDLGCAFNRKETMIRGENSVFVGMKPGAGDKLLIVDDIISSGTSLRDTVGLLNEQAPDAKVIGSVIAVDCKDRGRDKRISAVAETQYELGIPIFSIVDIGEIVGILKNGDIHHNEMSEEKAALPTMEQIAAVENYLEELRIAC